MAKRKPQINWSDDAASTLRKLIEKAIKTGSKEKVGQATSVASKAANTAKKQGKAATSAAAREMASEGRKRLAGMTAKEKMLKEGVARRERADVLKKNTKRFNKIEVEKAKGKGTYTSTTGKTKNVSKERAAEGRSRAGAMESQWKKDAAKQRELENKVKNARTSQEKIQARRELAAWRKAKGR